MNTFYNLADVLNAFPDEESCISHLETLRWNGIVKSPFNPISKVYKCKKQYRCNITKKYFTVKTGTLFHNSKIPLRQWFVAIWILTSHKPHITSVGLSKELNITQKTAWFMIQRIKNYYTIEKKSPNNKSNWPLLNNKGVQQENVYIQNIKTEKMEWIEWLKMLKN